MRQCSGMSPDDKLAARRATGPLSGGPESIVAVVGVGLRRMGEDEFANWLPRAREDYANDMARNGGADLEAARAKAMRDSERLFPGGLPSAEQLVFVIEADGERVGELWLAGRDGELRRVLYVWNIRIDEQHRGRGFGKQAMLLAEAEARRRGLTHIGLSVMGGNETASGSTARSATPKHSCRWRNPSHASPIAPKDRILDCASVRECHPTAGPRLFLGFVFGVLLRARITRQIRLVPGTHASPPTRSTTPHHRDVPAIPLLRIAPKKIAAPVTPAESLRRSLGRAGSNQPRKLIVLRWARQDRRLTSFDRSPLVCASVQECPSGETDGPLYPGFFCRSGIETQLRFLVGWVSGHFALADDVPDRGVPVRSVQTCGLRFGLSLLQYAPMLRASSSRPSAFVHMRKTIQTGPVKRVPLHKRIIGASRPERKPSRRLACASVRECPLI